MGNLDDLAEGANYASSEGLAIDKAAL
jgi:hypothetical protein